MSAIRHIPHALASDRCWFVYDSADAQSRLRGFYVLDDMGDLARSDWSTRFVYGGAQALHEYDDEAHRLYWGEESQPEASKPIVVIDAVTARQFARIQAKLDRWELEHLRELAARQAERIEELERDLESSDRAAEGWHHHAMDLQDTLRETGAGQVGLTITGQLLVLPPDQPAAQGVH